jgi:hypothetical protein
LGSSLPNISFTGAAGRVLSRRLLCPENAMTTDEYLRQHESLITKGIGYLIDVRFIVEPHKKPDVPQNQNQPRVLCCSINAVRGKDDSGLEKHSFYSCKVLDAQAIDWVLKAQDFLAENRPVRFVFEIEGAYSKVQFNRNKYRPVSSLMYGRLRSVLGVVVDHKLVWSVEHEDGLPLTPKHLNS